MTCIFFPRHESWESELSDLLLALIWIFHVLSLCLICYRFLLFFKGFVCCLYVAKLCAPYAFLMRVLIFLCHFFFVVAQLLQHLFAFTSFKQCYVIFLLILITRSCVPMPLSWQRSFSSHHTVCCLCYLSSPGLYRHGKVAERTQKLLVRGSADMFTAFPGAYILFLGCLASLIHAKCISGTIVCAATLSWNLQMKLSIWN